MRTIIFLGCFLMVGGSAWAQFGEDLQQSARQLQPNPPGYPYGQLTALHQPGVVAGLQFLVPTTT